MLFRRIILVLLLSFCIISSAFASGTRSPGSGGYTSGNSSRPTRSAEDITYEYGKSIFTGRSVRYGRIKFCVPDASNKLSKVKKSTLKLFAGVSVKEFSNNLYDCNSPNQKIMTVLKKADLTALVFYLNKRYKLRLN